MPKYLFSAQITVSCYTEVEATSKQEALEVAKDRDVANLPNTAVFGWNSENEWVIDELDGEPRKIQLSGVE